MLESIVRPNQSPDYQPASALSGTQATEAAEGTVVSWGSSGNGVFEQKVRFASQIPPTYEQTERHYDKVRIKNPDDPDQHVDVEVTTKYIGRNKIDRSRYEINFEQIQPVQNQIEVLSRGNKSGTDTGN